MLKPLRLIQYCNCRVLITTQQGGITYVVDYATHLGKMAEFEGVFQNMLNSMRFGSVGFSGSSTTSDVPAPSEIGSADELAALTSNNSLSDRSQLDGNK